MLPSPKLTIETFQDASEQELAMPRWYQRYTQIGCGRFQGSNVHLDFGTVAVGEERTNVVLAEKTSPPAGTVALCVPGRAGSGFINGAREDAPAFIHIGGNEIDLTTGAQTNGFYITVAETALPDFDRRRFAPISSASHYPGAAELAGWMSSILTATPEGMRRTPGEVEKVLPAYIVDRVSEILGYLAGQDTDMQLRQSYAYTVFRKARLLAEERPEAIWTVTALADVLHVPEHVLRSAFLQTTGISPRIWLRHRRLDMARRAMLNPKEARKGVAQIAMESGFFHLGRFAAYYAQTFCETPIETIRSVLT